MPAYTTTFISTGMKSLSAHSVSKRARSTHYQHHVSPFHPRVYPVLVGFNPNRLLRRILCRRPATLGDQFRSIILGTTQRVGRVPCGKEYSGRDCYWRVECGAGRYRDEDSEVRVKSGHTFGVSEASDYAGGDRYNGNVIFKAGEYRQWVRGVG